MKKPTMTNSAYHQSIELVERFAQCLIKDFKNKRDMPLIKQLAPYVTYFNNEIKMNTKSDEIFENFIDVIDAATEKLDLDCVVKEFEEKIEEARNQLPSGENCQKYIDFMEMISRTISEQDGEITAVSQTVNTIDPISKRPIVEPVKNTTCGHIYEKSTIFELIGQNPRTKCPIAGCNVSEFVKETDLVPDTALKRILSSAGSTSPKKVKHQE